jgi:hypothetical protein
VSPQIGRRVTWKRHGPTPPRKGILVTPSVWPGSWWAAADTAEPDDVHGCALIRPASDTTRPWEPYPEDSAEMRQVRSLLALRALGVAP